MLQAAAGNRRADTADLQTVNSNTTGDSSLEPPVCFWEEPGHDPTIQLQMLSWRINLPTNNSKLSKTISIYLTKKCTYLSSELECP